MKTLLILGVACCLLVSTAAMGQTHINIGGDNNTLLAIVESRLQEYNQAKP